MSRPPRKRQYVIRPTPVGRRLIVRPPVAAGAPAAPPQARTPASRAAQAGEPAPRTIEEICLELHSRPRRELIAEAAYFRAARRGFHGGDPTEDWLEAEAEVDRSLREALARRLCD